MRELPAAGSPSRPAYGNESTVGVLQARGPSRRLTGHRGAIYRGAPTRPGEQRQPPGRTPRPGQGWPSGAPPRLVRGAPRPFATSSVTVGPDRRFRNPRHMDRWEVPMLACVGGIIIDAEGRQEDPRPRTGCGSTTHAEIRRRGSTRRPFVAVSGGPLAAVAVSVEGREGAAQGGSAGVVRPRDPARGGRDGIATVILHGSWPSWTRAPGVGVSRGHLFWSGFDPSPPAVLNVRAWLPIIVGPGAAIPRGQPPRARLPGEVQACVTRALSFAHRAQPPTSQDHETPPDGPPPAMPPSDTTEHAVSSTI